MLSACSEEEARLRGVKKFDGGRTARMRQTGLYFRAQTYGHHECIRRVDYTHIPHHILSMVGERLIFHSLMSLLNFKIKLYKITCKTLLKALKCYTNVKYQD